MYDFLKKCGSSVDHQKHRGVPINVEFEVSAITKYQADLDQIMTNFIPFFVPSVYVAWKHPKYPDQVIKSQLLWSGSVQIQNPSDIGKNDPQLWQMSTSFTFKTYVFAGTTADSDTDGVINLINLSYDSLFDVGDPGFGQSNFYVVPNSISIEDFKANVIGGSGGWDFDTVTVAASASADASGYPYDGFIADGFDHFYLADQTVFDVSYDGD
jgi:hypothetical protein